MVLEEGDNVVPPMAKEPAMDLVFDAKARRLLDHRRASNAVLITIVGNYGMPGSTLAAEWRPLEQVMHDPDLVRLDVQNGVPIYAHRRLATYARWHPLHVTTHSLGWWPSFAIERGEQVWRDLVHWERTHPSLLSSTPLA
jgi:hypothetical protein